MDKIELIKKCITDAVSHKSKLTEQQLSVGGFTSTKIRHLLNNLGAISTGYYEIGSHIGCSLVSACYGNENLKSMIACDSFCEFQNDGKTKSQFLQNATNSLGDNFTLIEKDCFTVIKEELPDGIDFYLFDGAHDYDSQKKGMTYTLPMLAEEVIVCVDDTSWQAPRRGTFDGFAELGYQVIYEQSLWDGVESNSDGWWNGFLVALIKKDHSWQIH